MSKIKTLQILIIALSLLIVLGIVLGITIKNSHNDFEKNITLGETEETSETLDVSLNGFYPGLSKEYVVNLCCAVDGIYEVSLVFVKKGEGTLENYIETVIEVDGKQVGESLLKSYFDGEIVQFSCNLSKSEKVKLVTRYIMPQEVGNEAQRAISDFSLDVTVSKK